MRGKVTLHAYLKGVALNTYKENDESTSLTDEATLNTYGSKCLWGEVWLWKRMTLNTYRSVKTRTIETYRSIDSLKIKF